MRCAPPLAFLALFMITAGMVSGALACNEPYPPSMVKGFMANCSKGNPPEGYCGCLIATIQKTIPLAEFIEVGTQEGGVNSDARYIRANQTCVKRFTLPRGEDDSGTK